MRQELGYIQAAAHFGVQHRWGAATRYPSDGSNNNDGNDDDSRTTQEQRRHNGVRFSSTASPQQLVKPGRLDDHDGDIEGNDNNNNDDDDCDDSISLPLHLLQLEAADKERPGDPSAHYSRRGNDYDCNHANDVVRTFVKAGLTSNSELKDAPLNIDAASDDAERQLHTSRPLYVFDIRPLDAFNRSHVPDSIHLDLPASLVSAMIVGQSHCLAALMQDQRQRHSHNSADDEGEDELSALSSLSDHITSGQGKRRFSHLLCQLPRVRPGQSSSMASNRSWQADVVVMCQGGAGGAMDPDQMRHSYEAGKALCSAIEQCEPGVATSAANFEQDTSHSHGRRWVRDGDAVTAQQTPRTAAHPSIPTASSVSQPSTNAAVASPPPPPPRKPGRPCLPRLDTGERIKTIHSAQKSAPTATSDSLAIIPTPRSLTAGTVGDSRYDGQSLPFVQPNVTSTPTEDLGQASAFEASLFHGQRPTDAPVFNVSTILPGFLYLGPDVTSVSEADWLQRRGVKRVLNCAAEIGPELCGRAEDSLNADARNGTHNHNQGNDANRGCCDTKACSLPSHFEQYLKLPMVDHVEAPDIQSHIERGCSFLDEAHRSCSPVYVHCRAGKSRSVCIVIGWLMRSQGWTMKRAYEYVSQRRPDASPNIAFVSCLMAFEDQLCRQSDLRA
ncbi:unnamed protein product [Jaminaea pallidilutea]